jgi:hypothetical protein
MVTTGAVPWLRGGSERDEWSRQEGLARLRATGAMLTTRALNNRRADSLAGIEGMVEVLTANCTGR